MVESCEFLENVGPDFFSASAKDICPLEKEWKQLFARTQKFPMIFYLFNFLSLTKVDIAEFANKFKNPFLSGNRFHDVPDKLFQRSPPTVCSACWQDLQSDGDWIECPSCYVARYCSQQCLDTAKDFHYAVCNSILEGNKESEPLWPLVNPSVKVSGQVEAGCSLCVCAAVNVFTADKDGTRVLFRGCLLTCPERNFFTVLRSPIIHDFIMIHGSPIKESMMDIKVASILANFDPESQIVTVFSHRVFFLY